mgnify:CR=1 FL=1
MLQGTPGFIDSPDARTLRIEALPAADDPVRPWLHEGAAVGLLGLEPHTRRRNRANGIVRAIGSDGFVIDVSQSFGNCAQYIQTRYPRPRPSVPAATEQIASLDPAARRLIAGADTFFVASRSREGLTSGGLDVSHRGGRPGFVGVNELMGVHQRIVLDFPAGYGFAGIAVALMGRNHPLGIALAALLFGALQQGGAELAFEIPSVTRETVVVIQGLVILFSGALAQMPRPWLQMGLQTLLGRRN